MSYCLSHPEPVSKCLMGSVTLHHTSNLSRLYLPLYGPSSMLSASSVSIDPVSAGLSWPKPHVVTPSPIRC